MLTFTFRLTKFMSTKCKFISVDLFIYMYAYIIVYLYLCKEIHGQNHHLGIRVFYLSSDFFLFLFIIKPLVAF